ncbi:hypothetical protein [Bradyrhizobium sp. USDA 4350]
MTDGQYRAIVAYLNFWPKLFPDFGLDKAIRDIGITVSRDDVIEQLAKAGHRWDDETRTLTYDDDPVRPWK